MSNVAVLGASGGIGQPLSLLVKLSPNLNIKQLNLYDLRLSKGVSQDLSHINTDIQVNGYEPSANTNEEKQKALKQTLTNTDIVIIPAGIPRKPGMTRDDLFKINASIIEELATAIANYSPNATVLVISNPVNSTVPIIKEVLTKFGVFNPNKLFGITTLDIVRAKTFISTLTRSNEFNNDNIHVIGGHSGETIVPVYSSLSTYKKISKSELETLTNRVQFGGDEVVKAKNGAGSATLSMAYSGFKFAEFVLKAANNSNPADLALDSFVYLDDSIQGSKQVKDFIIKKFGKEYLVDFFSLPVRIVNGKVTIAYEILYKLNDYELSLLKIALKQLRLNIVKGANFVNFKNQSKL
jgi:malate dehydrogenase